MRQVDAENDTKRIVSSETCRRFVIIVPQESEALPINSHIDHVRSRFLSHTLFETHVVANKVPDWRVPVAVFVRDLMLFAEVWRSQTSSLTHSFRMTLF